MEVIRTENLIKTYSAGHEVNALRGIDMKIKEGELVAVMGQSGSGKSTLLHLLGGVDIPTSGKVYIKNTDIATLNESEMAVFRRKNIGIIYQFFNLIDSMTVRKNIIVPTLLDGKSVDEEYFNELIETLGLKEKLDSFPQELSGGQQQRVAIARSLINRPAVILADEPTGNLDRKNSSEIVELLKVVNRKFNTTVLIITHDEEVGLACDRILTMVDGKLSERCI